MGELASSQPTNSPGAISKTSDCSAENSRLIREWLAVFAELKRIELSSSIANAWEMALCDLPLADLRRGLESCLRECVYLPMPAEVRKFAARPQQAAAALDIEVAWQRLLDHCRRYVDRDLGQIGPPLPPELDFAARAAGGLFSLEGCSERDLVFAKQRFVEALARYQEGVERYAQLPEGPAKQLIAAAAAKKALPTARPKTPSPSSNNDDPLRPPKAVLPQFELLPPIKTEEQ